MPGRLGRIGMATTLCVAATALAAPAAHAYVYWADELKGTIGRAANDGTMVEPRFITGANIPMAVAVDSNHVYWADEAGKSIGRAKIDGSGVEHKFISLAKKPSGVAVDGSYVFWSTAEGEAIGRANLDGGNPLPNLVIGAKQACGVAVDAGHVYWAADGGVAEPAIGRASLGGLSVDHAFVDAESSPIRCGVAVDELNVYWAELGFLTGTRIGRADVSNGMSPDPSFIGGASAPCGVASFGSQLYWANLNTNTIGRANRNASGVDQSFIATGGTRICGVAVDALAPPPPPPPGPLGPTPDKGAPQTTIAKGPGKQLDQGIAKFSFKSSEAGSTFQCKLDGRKPARCKSPKRYTGLRPGRHTFKVWATDRAGNKDQTPAKRGFRVPAR
jgi:hypothetical protein